MSLGVAISTTGDKHRMGLLAECVLRWEAVLTEDAPFVVTVDGPEEAYDRVRWDLSEISCSVVRVGQPTEGWNSPLGIRDGRLGVAANKNTGIEWLMGHGTQHLWLSDDDTWPLSCASLDLHRNLSVPHSLVCWGARRRQRVSGNLAYWTWPRGAVMFVTSVVVDRVGGMIEAFGPGGHEHVEWSQRINNAGFTPAQYVSPAEYADDNWMGARRYWHGEDMAKTGERLVNLAARRRRLTSVRREPSDPAYYNRLLAERSGSTDFVPYTAVSNRRWSATL